MGVTIASGLHGSFRKEAGATTPQDCVQHAAFCNWGSSLAYDSHLSIFERSSYSFGLGAATVLRRRFPERTCMQRLPTTRQSYAIMRVIMQGSSHPHTPSIAVAYLPPLNRCLLA